MSRDTITDDNATDRGCPSRAAHRVLDEALATASFAGAAGTYAVVTAGIVSGIWIAVWLTVIVGVVLLGVPHLVAWWLNVDVDALLAGDREMPPDYR